MHFDVQISVLYKNIFCSENLFKMVGDIYATEGYKEAGWEYVVMGDCWLAKERDEQGRVQPDPVRFPSGIPSLVQFVSSPCAVHFRLSYTNTVCFIP